MTFFRNLRQLLVLPLATLMLANSLFIGVAHGGLVTTDQVVQSEAAAGDRARVMAFLQRADVRDQMQAMGVDPREASARVLTLSDAEISQIAGRIDTMPAGEGIVGTVVGIAVLILIVLVITDVLGITNAFTFIKPMR